ncbi:MAG TPA: hypothetical protein VF902_08470, partial [Coriobacteriia bacterium]
MAPQPSHGQPAPPGAQQQYRQSRPAQRRLTTATAARALVLLALAVSFTVLGTASAFAITRAGVLERAQTWIDSPVPYSQLRYFGGYRTDCSGYVSMCWQTGTSWSTRSVYRVSRPIAAEELKPGDAMLKAGYHIRLFYGWVDAEHTRYVAYEQTGPATTSSIKSMPEDLARGYVPYRYNAIQDGPPPADALLNGAFDVWARGEPVWWSLSGSSREETPVVQHNDVTQAGGFSLELVNTNSRNTRFASIEQTAPISPDTPYALSAWARTAGDPRRLELRLRYLDASGGSLVDTRTTGEAWGVDDTGFKQMSLSVGSPPGAATAVVTVRFAGAVDASGTAGDSVLLDEISLAQPKSSITIQANATTTGIGRTPILSGSVTPSSAIGKNVVVYVRKPGRAYYSYSSNRTVYALGDGAAWQYKYYF